MKKIALLFLVFVISACQSAPVLNETTPISTIVPVTQTFKPTYTPEPPTETPNPLANAPEGTTGFDNNGEPIREVTYDNEQKFEFRLNEQGEWVRLLNDGPFFILVSPQGNGIPLSITIKEGTPGGESILLIYREPVTNYEDQSPITSATIDPLVRRLKGISAPRLSQDQDAMIQFIKDVQGSGISYDLILPNETEEGKRISAKFGEKYGVNVLIVPPSELEPLVEKKLAVKFTLYNTEIIYTFDGVKDGSASCRIASTTPLNELQAHVLHGSDYNFRRIMFICFAAIMEGEDVRYEYNNSIDHLLAMVSTNKRADGEQDVQIITAGK